MFAYVEATFMKYKVDNVNILIKYDTPLSLQFAQAKQRLGPNASISKVTCSH